MKLKSGVVLWAMAEVLLFTGAWAAEPATPTTYLLEPRHSFARFSYDHLRFSIQESRFNKVSGTVVYDPEGKKGSVEVTIDTRSVDTGSDEFDEHIQRPEFLDTAKFPMATFKSTEVTFRGDEPVSIAGNLTLKGITRPVVLTVTRFHHGQNMAKKDAIGANAVASIKRSDFDMGALVPMVSDEINLTIVMEAAAP
jgi:polyisoprenoid-binding protein YceI